jgi:hypothetical protein
MKTFNNNEILDIGYFCSFFQNIAFININEFN